MKLYESGEDYLEAILILQKKLGTVRSIDIARHMEVSKPSVCHAVTALRKGGFLTMDDRHLIYLTEEGRRVAEKIYERHKFFKKQLISVGINPSIAETEACRLEHCISDESFLKLKKGNFDKITTLSKEVSNMCTALERLKNEGRQEGISDLIFEWTKEGYSTEAIAKLLKKPEEFVKKIQEESKTLA